MVDIKDLLRHSGELEARVEWLEKGLNEIYQDLVGKPMKARDHKDAQRLLAMVQSISDGEPTTADEFNEAQIQEGEELMKEYGDHEG
tara:strand:+ start:222 stop:482 length:261 start_codon:yes stop_codon:yes gene_type:complete